ncbi:phosphate-starvation-inducible PsiE family protein [Biformimicrobium ophioploci]|uniref:Phosphate-starvation-inducible E-like protein n=1 Tax=Biformimicrobium ophioploci TaxID=3036711 RepID=A0ABQ6LVZ8_9GAMM|nr:phosphate-starvation-inducible PsiE family protein [Microbulbifer sp. NKW57]GMG86274.1 hypothetical protein MNKW57_05950 [Microbulbifer sp. NKW57]
MGKKLDTALEGMRVIKRWMVFIVLLILVIVVAASIIELTIILYRDLTNNPDNSIFLDSGELLRIFGFAFMVIIGFELIEAIEVYFRENIIHAEVVILIAVIAMSRKVILLDLSEYDPVAVIGLSMILLALGGSYFAIKKAQNLS